MRVGSGGEGLNRRVVRRQEAQGWSGTQAHPKTPVLGMVERGGRVSAVVVADKSALVLCPHLRKQIDEVGTEVFTDEHPAYVALDKSGFVHNSIRHNEGVYVSVNVPHADHRELLVAGEGGHLRCLPRSVSQASSRLSQRVRVDLQPPRRRCGDVPATTTESGRDRKSFRSLNRRRRNFAHFSVG